MLAASPLDVRKGSAFPDLAYHTLEATPPKVPRRSFGETKSRRPESQRLSAHQTAEPFQRLAQLHLSGRRASDT